MRRTVTDVEWSLMVYVSLCHKQNSREPYKNTAEPIVLPFGTRVGPSNQVRPLSPVGRSTFGGIPIVQTCQKFM